MKLTLVRTRTGADCINGVLYHGKHRLCDTLERPRIVPIGWYRLTVTQSPKFKRLLPLLLHVPGHSGIRIHAGNSIRDTNGCILVGSATADGKHLTDSKQAERDIVKLLQNSPIHEEHYIEIATPEYRSSELECMQDCA